LELAAEVRMNKITTIPEVLALKPPMIYYAMNTVWWTHDPKDMRKDQKIPLDFFGSPLLQTAQVEQFADLEAIKVCGQYGKYPITVFTMAHAKNLIPMLQEHHARFAGHIEDVKVYANFTPRIEELVDAGLIVNLDKTEVPHEGPALH
jgi:hypothetical protein